MAHHFQPTEGKHKNVDIRKIPKAPAYSFLANRLYTNQKRDPPTIPPNVIVIFSLYSIFIPLLYTHHNIQQDSSFIIKNTTQLE